MEKQDPVIIVGGGIAGVTCARVFSMDNPNERVTLVSASPLVKTVSNLKTLGRSMDIFDVIEQNASNLESANLKIINKKVIKLNANLHQIQLDDGSWLKYKKLCICTGAKPRTIDIDDDVARKYVKYIRDTVTAKDFASNLCGSKKILVAGNGGIATEVVYAVKDVEIVWAIREKTFGAVFFDAGAAKFFSEFLNDFSKDNDNHISKRARYTQTSESDSVKNEFGVALGPDWSNGLDMKGKSIKNVTLETNVEIVKIYSTLNSIPKEKEKMITLDPLIKETWNIYVELTNGKIIGCDLIVAGFGVIPNHDVFISDNKFNLGSDNGILVDEQMRTNIDDIYAAGDVCTAGWDQAEHWFQLRLWTQARQMGFYAAKCIQANLNGTDPSLYFNFEMFAHVTKFFGFRVILLGLFDGQKLLSNDYKILCKVIPRKEYLKVIIQNDKMKGAILIGDNNLEETFEFLIYNQIDLARFGDHILDDVIDVEDFFD